MEDEIFTWNEILDLEPNSFIYSMGYWFAREEYEDIVKWCKGDED